MNTAESYIAVFVIGAVVVLGCVGGVTIGHLIEQTFSEVNHILLMGK